MTEEKKREILTFWPEAKWFPGDPAPVGMKVERVDWPGRVFTVIGVQPPGKIPLSHPCPMCRCTMDDSLAGWWITKMDGSEDRFVQPPFALRTV